MSESTERHARETLARAGAAMHVSRELVRQARIVMNTFADGEEALKSGEYKVNPLYRLAIGDYREGVHVLMPKGMRDELTRVAKQQGITRNDLIVEALLTQIFGEEPT